jgi:hypothetical protein
MKSGLDAMPLFLLGDLLNNHLDVFSGLVQRGEATSSWKKQQHDMGTGNMLINRARAVPEVPND